MDNLIKRLYYVDAILKVEDSINTMDVSVFSVITSKKHQFLKKTEEFVVFEYIQLKKRKRYKGKEILGINLHYGPAGSYDENSIETIDRVTQLWDEFKVKKNINIKLLELERDYYLSMYQPNVMSYSSRIERIGEYVV